MELFLKTLDQIVSEEGDSEESKPALNHDQRSCSRQRECSHGSLPFVDLDKLRIPSNTTRRHVSHSPNLIQRVVELIAACQSKKVGKFHFFREWNRKGVLCIICDK